MVQDSDPRELPTGTRVLIKKANRCGELISGPDRRGLYEITLGPAVVRLLRQEFDIAQPKEQQSRKFKAPGPHAGGSAKLDLHGLTTAEAVKRMEDTLDRALVNGLSTIEVVHGVGSGAVKRAILSYLTSSPHISRFAEDTLNPGVTWVYL